MKLGLFWIASAGLIAAAGACGDGSGGGASSSDSETGGFGVTSAGDTGQNAGPTTGGASAGTAGNASSAGNTGGNAGTAGGSGSSGSVATTGSSGTPGSTSSGATASTGPSDGGPGPTTGGTATGTGTNGGSATATTGASATGAGTTGSSATGTGTTGRTTAGGSTTGSASTGSSTTGGTTAGTSFGGACRPKFASGDNVAWIRFGNDVPNPDIASFTTVFQNTHDAGGRVIRWWFHANGLTTPGYDSSGLATQISAANIADVKKILDAAHAAGVMVDISLWSFDMLQSSANKILTQNKNLLMIDANRQAYIDRVLTPLVTALKGYPGLYAWEIFNEPEGMTTQHGWVPMANRIDEKYVQITVNWLADAIHNADPSALVTNGAWTFVALSGAASGGQNYYSDSALMQAGGKSKGKLDFYEVHYYASNGANVSPFTHKATNWALDKPLVIGEFWALDTDGVGAADLYTTLYDNGYDGAWAWQYWNNDNNTMNTKWPAMQVPMQKLYAAHAADINCP